MMQAVPASDTALSAEFVALYHAQFDFVWRTLRRFGVPDAALDDATQDVFVVVHRRFGAWEQRTSVRAWLFGVAKRVASKHRRGHERHERKVAALPPPANEQALDERMVDRDRLARIGRAIDCLSPERREVYVLAELEGLTGPEIADALALPLNTVYSRLRRARSDLECALADASVREPPDRAVPGIGRRSNHGRTG
jgi:RNA polymerase sigma-70 factor, ECF subfamily